MTTRDEKALGGEPVIATAHSPEVPPVLDVNQKQYDLIVHYPKSARKVSLEVKPYSMSIKNHYHFEEGLFLDGSSTDQSPINSTSQEKIHTTHVSPHGLEFQTSQDYQPGTLLKIHLSLPDYWSRKQGLVDYTRIDAPSQLKLLAKVVASKDIGKRGKKKLMLVQTVNIDEVDEKVLAKFIEDEKS